MDKASVIEELEFEIVIAQKGGKVDLIPGLERAITIIDGL